MHLSSSWPRTPPFHGDNTGSNPVWCTKELNMITICEWPDGTWCELEDLEGYLQWMSDDFIYKSMPIEVYEEQYLGE